MRLDTHSVEQLGIPREPPMQQFRDQLAPDLLVDDQENLAHAALAEPPQDAIGRPSEHVIVRRREGGLAAVLIRVCQHSQRGPRPVRPSVARKILERATRHDIAVIPNARFVVNYHGLRPAWHPLPPGKKPGGSRHRSLDAKMYAGEADSLADLETPGDRTGR